jgi:putative phosphoesterase
MMRVVVVADTHMRAGRARTLPAQVWDAIDRSQLVLHAGDVVDHTLLDAMAERGKAPVTVHGNNDAALPHLPERRELEIEGVRVAMVHETGATKGRPARVRRWFPDATVVVFGHSHDPCNEWHDGQLLFNPGSPTERRRQPHHSYGVLDLDAGRVVKSEIVLVN